MLQLLASLVIAQAQPSSPQPSSPQPPSPQPEVVTIPQEIRTLPGQLDNILVFNSNSPEVVQTEGILLSTFPKSGKEFPQAHLDLAFKGRFDLFAHHIAKATGPEDRRTLYLGVILQNPGSSPVKVDILQAASYLSQPDAPFIKLDSISDNTTGSLYAGPGDRVTNDVLRGKRQSFWPSHMVIPPGEQRMLLNVPIPVKELDPPLNGRSVLARLRSNGNVYMASLAMFGKSDSNGAERSPTLEEWTALLASGDLAGPRDKTPTPPRQAGQLIYGRVAGVAKGSVWKALIMDPQSDRYALTIPETGASFSYPVSTVDRGTFGTQQIQSANILKRYEDTAYAAHGNYGIEYQLTLPLYNPTSENQKVSITLQTALKTDEKKAGLEFREPPSTRVFFRGTARVRYQDPLGLPKTRYVHMVHLQGQQGEPLVTLDLKPKQKSLVQVDFIYPPDSTPPQTLTVKTLNAN